MKQKINKLQTANNSLNGPDSSLLIRLINLKHLLITKTMKKKLSILLH